MRYRQLFMALCLAGSLPACLPGGADVSVPGESFEEVDATVRPDAGAQVDAAVLDAEVYLDGPSIGSHRDAAPSEPDAEEVDSDAEEIESDAAQLEPDAAVPEPDEGVEPDCELDAAQPEIDAAPRIEICNGVDDDGDGQIDEGLVTLRSFMDADHDGYGDPGRAYVGCDIPDGNVLRADDCNDMLRAVHPDVPEVCDDAFDNNCNGTDNEGCGARDQDGDGDPDSTDCARLDPSVGHNEPELCNDRDDDCDGQTDEGVRRVFNIDSDGDGRGSIDASFSVFACSAPHGYVGNDDDCNDLDPDIYPGHAEICGDGLDNDCSGGADPVCQQDDNDHDGALNHDDCEPENASVHPGARELCNNRDDDCDGISDEGVETAFYPDVDRDGFGNRNAAPVMACAAPANHVGDTLPDCNDQNATVHPGHAEICGDGLDNDCSGGADVACQNNDRDGDRVSNDLDCEPDNAAVFPGNREVCNGVDDNCVGGIDEGLRRLSFPDVDHDSYGDDNVAGVSVCVLPAGTVDNNEDCADNNANVHPGVLEVCGDGLDNDCDGGRDPVCNRPDQFFSATVTFPGNREPLRMSAEFSNTGALLGQAGMPRVTPYTANTDTVTYSLNENDRDFNAVCRIRLSVEVGDPAHNWLCEGTVQGGNAHLFGGALVRVVLNNRVFDNSSITFWSPPGGPEVGCSVVVTVSNTGVCQR